MISEYTLPWIAAESAYGLELALEWIKHAKPLIASAGWATLASLVAIKPDTQLDLPLLYELLRQVKNTIATAPNRVRYSMNGFVIALGCYVPDLTARAKETALAIGPDSVDMGGTACRVPAASDYIRKVETAGRLWEKNGPVLMFFATTRYKRLPDRTAFYFLYTEAYFFTSLRIFLLLRQQIFLLVCAARHPVNLLRTSHFCKATAAFQV